VQRIEIKGEQQTISEVFSERYAFEVPPYQRPYAWTTEQAGELLDDLIGIRALREVQPGSVKAFLGLADPTSITWGTTIEFSFLRTAISSGAWWAVIPAGLCVALVIMACFWFGQAIEDALNPRLKVSYVSPRGFHFRPVPGEEE
jgi:hypothetical protein